jgi:hypothetical protein
MKGPGRSNLVYSTMAYTHGGLALLGVDLHKVGNLLALTNFLVPLHITTEAPKRHLTNLGDTTLQKVIDVVVDDELLALVLQNDSLPNTQISLTDLAMVEEGIEWKATWKG